MMDIPHSHTVTIASISTNDALAKKVRGTRVKRCGLEKVRGARDRPPRKMAIFGIFSEFFPDFSGYFRIFSGFFQILPDFFRFLPDFQKVREIRARTPLFPLLPFFGIF